MRRDRRAGIDRGRSLADPASRFPFLLKCTAVGGERLQDGAAMLAEFAELAEHKTIFFKVMRLTGPIRAF